MLEVLILQIDPVPGDKGDERIRVLSDKFVDVRKSHECYHCAREIIQGERVRVKTDIYEGELQCMRWCCDCCEAMGKSQEDDWDAYIKRQQVFART